MRLLLCMCYLALTLAGPSPCPSDESIVGYSDWATLKNDVRYYLNGETYIVCPDSHFTLSYGPDNAGLHISHKRDNPLLTIQCANDNCVVDGGHHHIWITYVGSAIIKGFTFRNSDRGSIYLGTGNGPVTFEDCIWEDNVYYVASDTTCELGIYGCAGVMGGQYSSAILRQCQIIGSSGYTGAIFGQGMDYTLDHCLFDGNKSTWKYYYGQPTGSALTLWDGSELSASHSCFINNDAAGVGTVKTSEVAKTLYLNDANFFEQNIVRMANLDTGKMCPSSIYVLDWNDIDQCVPGDGDCCDGVLYGANCPAPVVPIQAPVAPNPAQVAPTPAPVSETPAPWSLSGTTDTAAIKLSVIFLLNLLVVIVLVMSS